MAQTFKLSQKYRDYQTEVSSGLTPEDVGTILDLATRGDCQRQSKLAEEILEKNWEIQTAASIRQAAVVGTEWQVMPAKEADGAGVPEKVETLLETIPGNPDKGWLSFREFLASCCQALLPGFSCHEIIWGPGGNILGFHHVPARHFTFQRAGVSDYYRPLLIRDGDGKTFPEALAADKWVIHRMLPRGGDPCRGGLIRPLAWLHVFMGLTMKDFLRALEKFGMPFLMARCQLGEDKAFRKEVEALQDVIENFGPDGGGVFSGASDLQFIQANTTGFEVYAQFLVLIEQAIAKSILGQTSTTSATNSNRSVGQVHNLVRHDLRVSDCRGLQATITQQVIAPLVRYQFGPQAPVPQFVFDCQPWRDVEVVASTVKTLSDAGLEVENVDELSRQVGLKLRAKPEPKPAPMLPGKPAEPEKVEA